MQANVAQQQQQQQQQDYDQLILSWQEAQKQSAYWREREMSQRKEIIEAFFKDKPVGTHNVPLGGGYKLKAVLKQSFKIERDPNTGGYENVGSAVAQLPAEIALGIVKWKPELSESAYKKLTEDQRAVVNTFVVIGDAAPTLELVQPKIK